MTSSSANVETSNASNGIIAFKRDTKYRIFVNKSLQLGKIKFFGFDMDYTLAVYKSPALEIMSLELLIKRMIEIGYPKELVDIKYDPTFPIRGLWVDKKLGNLLKTDNYGNILMAYHGFNRMTNAEIISQYPNKFINLDLSRIMVVNTLYNLPEIFLIAATISHFESMETCVRHGTGFSINQTVTMNYTSIIKDIRDTMDYVHGGKEMSDIIVKDLDKYVKKTSKLPQMMLHLKSNGAKVFLLTNSNYEYTKKICQYILSCSDGDESEWKKYFDFIVTSANKPNFFLDGSLLKRVNEDTKTLDIGHHIGPMKSGCIYSGGSVEFFSKLINAKGSRVLYFGDHIFGDILKSKKSVGWKTCLIVPEIANEMTVWKNKEGLFDKLEALDYELAETYRNLDLGSAESPDVNLIRQKINEVSKSIETLYGQFGSLFRSGNRRTFFAEQVGRYADIYTTSCLNLIHYPMSYMFRAPFLSMPHESTVSHSNENNASQDDSVS